MHLKHTDWIKILGQKLVHVETVEDDSVFLIFENSQVLVVEASAWGAIHCRLKDPQPRKETPDEKAVRFGVDFAMPGADKTSLVYVDEFSNLTPQEYGRIEARVMAAIAKGEPPVLLRRGFFKKEGNDDEKK